MRCANYLSNVNGLKNHKHHLDKNKKNNNPDNILFLCSTCHQYLHQNKTDGIQGIKILLKIIKELEK